MLAAVIFREYSLVNKTGLHNIEFILIMDFFSPQYIYLAIHESVNYACGWEVGFLILK